MLIEGTIWLEPFGEQPRCLLERDALSDDLSAWQTLFSRHEEFSATGATLKRFHTLVARRLEAAA